MFPPIGPRGKSGGRGADDGSLANCDIGMLLFSRYASDLLESKIGIGMVMVWSGLVWFGEMTIG